jgi:uncharacterized protein (DUF302 family)
VWAHEGGKNLEQHARDNGIINRPSKYSVEETIDRLEAVLKSIAPTDLVE